MLTYVLLVLAFAVMGMPLFACLAGLGLLGLAHIGTAGTSGITDIYGDLTGEKAVSLSTIPLFTFAGYLMASAGTAKRLVRLGTAVLGWVPGGLAVLTLLVCAFFTTFTGASGVTIVAIGGLMLPAMERAGYTRQFSLGSVTAFGAVGLLFPPALPLIVYGIVFGINRSLGDATSTVEFSIEKFYLYAGIGPGLVLVGVLLLYCVYQGWRYKAPRGPFAWWRALVFPLVPLAPVGVAWGLAVDREFRAALVDALPELVIPFTVLGPLLLLGWQPPEGAALCALYVFVVEVFWYRDIGIGADLFKITRESMTLVGAIFMKIVGATLLKNYLVMASVPMDLFEWMKQYIHTPAAFLLVLNGVLLLVGGMMDIFSAIIVVVPLIVPAAKQFGIDPYHLGVIFLLNLEIGYLLPPAGLNIFIAAFRFNRPITSIYRAVVPFILLMLVSLAIVTYVPSVTRVPGHVATAPAAAAPRARARPQRRPAPRRARAGGQHRRGHRRRDRGRRGHRRRTAPRGRRRAVARGPTSAGRCPRRAWRRDAPGAKGRATVVAHSMRTATVRWWALAWCGLGGAAGLAGCRSAPPPEPPPAIPLTSRMLAPPPPEGRDSLTCLSDDEPASRDKLREVASDYFSFRLEYGDVLDAEWEAVQRELLFGTRSNRCSRLNALLDVLRDGMDRTRRGGRRTASGERGRR